MMAAGFRPYSEQSAMCESQVSGCQFDAAVLWNAHAMPAGFKPP